MIRIITPTGKLFQVLKTVPFAEKKDEFNKSVITKVEVAKDMSVNPTGIRCFVASQNDMFGDMSSVYVGNLKPEKVKEILNALLKDEFYDFSQFQYQKSKKYTIFDDVEIDGGNSLPYFDENIGSSFMDGTFCNSMPRMYSCEDDFDEEVLED